MRVTRAFLLPALVGAALAFAACAGKGAQNPSRGPAAGPHPTVKKSDASCQSCHVDSDRRLVEAWDAGPHGLNLVQCYVCHGPTGEGFTRTPQPQRCDGCHTREVQSVTNSRGRTQSCFTCHDPHRLDTSGKDNPHAAAQASGAQR